jgi:hypothetical protein
MVFVMDGIVVHGVWKQRALRKPHTFEPALQQRRFFSAFGHFRFFVLVRRVLVRLMHFF